jgi:uncharacterized membrane protein
VTTAAEPSYDGAPPAPSPLARGMAFAIYGLLFLALPTLGSSGLVALILAYAGRDGAAPLIRSHHRFQIRIFWIGLAMGAAAIALGFSAMMDAGPSLPPPMHIPRSPDAEQVAYRADAPLHPVEDRVDGPAFRYRFSTRALNWRTRSVLEGSASGLLFVFASLWSFIAPLYGAARLASGRPIGHHAG